MFKKKAPKVILRNIKHFSNKNDISLSKFRPDNSIYSDVNSPFGDDEDVSMTGVNNESLLDLVATTSKTKHVNISTIFGFLFSSSNFNMNNNEVIIQTPMEVSIKKSFALDINFLAVENKSAIAKTQFIRKLFSSINGFKGIKKAVLLAKKNKIIANIDVKKQEMHSDQTVIIKKNFIDTPKEIIITAVSKFGIIKLIKIQLIEIWQKTVIEFAKLD
ncbi:hypothetical protein G9A89_004770 [Geosiphon pyriformis]|nr:hypothetical protein G9A89_004770 [Geosiphon pyriformis]